MVTPSTELLAFTCPRCDAAVSATYYGPCDRCRADLRAKFLGEVTEMQVTAYEPKMNVTPNAVALKE